MNESLVLWWLVVVAVFITLITAEPAIYPESVKYAEDVCETNGGWKKIEEGYSMFSSVTCNNGAEFQYSWKFEWTE